VQISAKSANVNFRSHSHFWSSLSKRSNMSEIRNMHWDMGVPMIGVNLLTPAFCLIFSYNFYRVKVRNLAPSFEAVCFPNETTYRESKKPCYVPAMYSPNFVQFGAAILKRGVNGENGRAKSGILSARRATPIKRISEVESHGLSWKNSCGHFAKHSSNFYGEGRAKKSQIWPRFFLLQSPASRPYFEMKDLIGNLLRTLAAPPMTVLCPIQIC